MTLDPRIPWQQHYRSFTAEAYGWPWPFRFLRRWAGARALAASGFGDLLGSGGAV